MHNAAPITTFDATIQTPGLWRFVLAPVFASFLMMPALQGGVAHWSAAVSEWPDGSTVELDPVDSRIVYVAVGSQTLFRSTNGGEDWQQSKSETTYLTTLSPVPARPGFLYAAGAHVNDSSKRNVLLSTDYGASWQPRGVFTGGSEGLEVDPKNPGVVYFWTAGSVWKTTDGGLTWKSNRVTPGNLNCVAIDQFNSSLIYAGEKENSAGWTASSLWRSTDGGMTWTGMEGGLPRHAGVDSLATDPLRPGVVYAGMAGGGLYCSTDGGTSWQSVPAPVANTHLPAVALHRVIPGSVYVLSRGTKSAGLYRSLDGAINWTWIQLPAAPISGLAIDGNNPSVIYVGTSKGLAKTANGGGFWELINPGFNPSSALERVTDGVKGGDVVDEHHRLSPAIRVPAIKDVNSERAQFDSLLTSTARLGRSETRPSEVWLQSAVTTDSPPLGWANFGPASGAIGQAVVDPFNPGTVYFGPSSKYEIYYRSFPTWKLTIDNPDQGLFFRSMDGGESWETWDTGDWWNLTLGARAGLMYRIDRSLTLSKSTDFGRSWAPLGRTGVHKAMPDPFNPEIVWALRSNAIDKSTDGGASWRTALHGWAMDRIAIDPKSTQIVYVGASEQIFYDDALRRTTDGGESWSVAGIRGPEDILVDPERPGYVYVADPVFGILKSQDDGWTWIPANEGLPRPEAWRLAYEPAERVLYCGVSASSRGTIFKSTDAAASWQPTNPSLDDTIRSLAVVGPRCLLASSLSDLYRTDDAGATWSKSEKGLPMPAVWDVAVTPAAPDVIYIITSAGIFRTDDRGGQWVPINPELELADFVLMLATAPTDHSLLLAVTTAGFYLSRDRGDFWTKVFQSEQDGWRAGWRSGYVAVAPDDPNTFYITVVSSSTFPPVVHVTAMYRTRDAGQTWTTLPIDDEGGVPSEPVIGPRGRVYVIRSGRVWRSTDYGDSWTSAASLEPNTTDPCRVVTAPSNSSVLYAVTGETVVWQSRDSGLTWTPVAEFPYSTTTNSLVVDPWDEDRVYIATGGSVYMITASRRSVRVLAAEVASEMRLAVMARCRVLLVAAGRPYLGLFATVVPRIADRAPRRHR